MTKRTKVIALVLIALVIAAGAAYPVYDGVGGGQAKTEAFGVNLYASSASAEDFVIESLALLPEAGGMAMVYEVKPAVVSAKSVTELGRKLGFEGGAGTVDDGMRVAMLDPSGPDQRQLAVWVDSGAVEYAVLGGEVDKPFPPFPPTLPSSAEAEKIATDFLSGAGLLPSDAYVMDVMAGGSYTGEEGDYVTHLLVRFGHLINGLPTTGPGAKFAVRVAHEGEVVDVDVLKVWRDVEAYRVVSIKSAQEAYNELVAGKGTCAAPSKCARVLVEEVRLAYWMEAATDKQEYVVPVYEFEGKCLDKDGNYLEEDFWGCCEALRQ